MNLNILSKDPKIVSMNDFISKKDCLSIIETNNLKFKKSLTRNESKNYRISDVKTLDHQDKFLISLKDKLKSIFDLDKDSFEAAQLQRYKLGGEYKEHFDARDISNSKELEVGFKQRRTSAIIYLNEDFRGGETIFPSLEIKISPKQGTLILFQNCFGNSEFVHPLSSHRSAMIKEGEKWILSLWSTKEFKLI